MTVVVTNNPERSRYEARLDGELAGFAEYVRGPECVAFTHTEVLEQFEGQGVGSALARYSLDEIKAEATHQVIPQCSFYERYIDKHPEYAGLVADPD